MKLSARIGALEIDGDEVRLAVVKTGGRVPRVLELHAVRARYEEAEARTEALVLAVREAVARLKKRPVCFVLCMSSFHAVVRTLTIPFRGVRRVTAAVPFELERYLAIPIEELVVDFLHVLEKDGQTEVLAAGVRRAILQEQLDLLLAAGVDPEAVTLDAVGMTSLWRACLPAAKGLHAVVHARDGGSILAVTHNKSLVYFRHLAVPAAQFQDGPAEAAQQIQNSLRAFHACWKGGGEVLSLTVTGAGLLPECRESFESAFDLPIAYENLAARLNVPEPVDESAPARANVWEACIGAALGAAGGTFAFNFRKDEFAPGNRLAGLVPHVVMTACLVLAMFAGAIWYYRDGQARFKQDAAYLTERLAQVNQEIADLQGQGINVGGDIFAEPTFLDVLAELGRKMPDDKAAITQIRLEPVGQGDPWLIIEGDVKEDAAFAAAFDELKKSTLFKVDDDPGLEMARGKSTFRIVARKASGAQK